MDRHLPSRPEPRDITRHAEPAYVYPPHAVSLAKEPAPFDIRSLWGMMRRNWLLILLPVVAGIGAAYLYNERATPVYRSSATIRVEDDQATPGLGAVTYAASPPGQILTEMEVLKSRSLAERVVDSLDLQVRLSVPGESERNAVFSEVEVDPDAASELVRLERVDGAFRLIDADGRDLRRVPSGEAVALADARFTLAPSALEYDRIVFRVMSVRAAAGHVQEGLEVYRPSDDWGVSIVNLEYEDTDRHLAAEVPNALAAQFIAYRQRQRQQKARSAVEFLTGQLDTLGVQLAEAENRLRDFREANQVVSLEAEGTAEISQLAELEARRDAIRVERSALSRLLQELEAESDRQSDLLDPSPYRRVVSYPGLLQNPALTGMLTTLATLENERSQLLERRTPADPDVQALTGRIRDIETQMRKHVTTYHEGLTNQLASLENVSRESSGKLSTIPRKEVQYARLRRNVDLLGETFVQLQTRLKESEISEAVEYPNVHLVDEALVPTSPVRPQRRSNLMLGAILGLLLGVGISFTREHLDTRIHSRDDLKQATGVPVLGLIPAFRGGEGVIPVRSRVLGLLGRGGSNGERPARAEDGSPRLVTEHERGSAVSEAYRSLRTNITFSSAERLAKTFLVTSATPRDGKTTTVANLAITFAQQGLRVLLVDADMRRGIIHKLFRTSRTPGLSNVLVEDEDLDRGIRRVQLADGAEIDILPTGTVPPNPAELLSSSRMERLLEKLRERYDAVVFDSPPLTLVTDAAVLAPRVDSVMLVARSNQTERGALEFAMDHLRNVDATVRGTILNDVDYRRDGRYGYHAAYPSVEDSA